MSDLTPAQDVVLTALGSAWPLSTRQVTDAVNRRTGVRPLVVEQVYRTLVALRDRALVDCARPSGRRDTLWLRPGSLPAEVLLAAGRGGSPSELAEMVNAGRALDMAYPVERVCEAVRVLAAADLVRADVGPGAVLRWFGEPGLGGVGR